ncbi:zinc-ribbon domain-containing protein [Candidatus Woesearchaeota archaeon]|nr:zinc-ribbon domain-containing protein [Candidatus Woesearchaeota archaeon]
MANEDLDKIGKFLLGLLGGYLLIEFLKSMNRCRNCNNQIPPNYEYCPYCGAKR